MKTNNALWKDSLAVGVDELFIAYIEIKFWKAVARVKPKTAIIIRKIWRLRSGSESIPFLYT